METFGFLLTIHFGCFIAVCILGCDGCLNVVCYFLNETNLAKFMKKKKEKIKTLSQYFNVRGLRKKKKFEFKVDKPDFLTESQWESLAGGWQSWFFNGPEEYNGYDKERHPLSVFAAGVNFGHKCANVEFVKKQFDHVKEKCDGHGTSSI